MRNIWIVGVALSLSGHAWAQAPEAPAAQGGVGVSAEASAGGDGAASAVDATAAGAAEKAPEAPVVVAPPPAPEAAPAPAPAAPGAFESIKVESATASAKFGVLLQPAFEAAGSPTLDSATLNLFVRRARILIGFSLFKNFDFFFDTDFADLMKSSFTGDAAAVPPTNTVVKNTPGIYIQDVFGTAKVLDDALKVDVGYMLPPGSHNALQGAGTLYGWDYFSNTFRHSAAFGTTLNPSGRDAGAQLRGLIVGGHVEYRLGVFQGVRWNRHTDAAGAYDEAEGRNFFRTAGRVQVNLLDAEPGFFYGGSYLGTKKIISVGGAFDFQDKYRHFAGDAFVDLPLGPGVLTGQLNYNYWNGSSTVALPRQSALSAELGYLIKSISLSPIVRFENRWVQGGVSTLPIGPDELRIGGGLAYWPYGHNINLKAFVTAVMGEKASGASTPKTYPIFNLQAQLYAF